MTAEQGDDDGVRLHVGGLARGIDPKELAALIARALPSGASPRAEIMRDATTGIERGFGYVTVPPGEGVKAGAERAIAAYNGSRWRGNKIKVGLAKGDYLQRLKGEWDAAAKAKAKAAEEALVASGAKKPAEPYKARPCLRLRRRPGERIMLVDPTPIAWAKPPRQDPRAWKKNKEREAEEKRRAEAEDGEGGGSKDGEDGPHRRKRGVLGCRRRVDFPGREATCSTKCRELWRRHLQERAAEASAARHRSVDRLISGKEEAATSATATAAGVPNRRVPSRAGGGDGDDDDDAGELLPVGDTADLAPEEPPPAEGIEFVWDDDADEGDAVASGDEDDVDGEDDEDADGEYEEEEKEEEEEEEEEQAEDGQPEVDGANSSGSQDSDEQDDRERLEEDEQRRQAADAWGAGADGRATPAVPGEQTAAVVTGRAVTKRLERLGKAHGVELDDRLAELLSDGSDEEDGDVYGLGGGYDYELETAEKAAVAAVDPVAESSVEGMRDRLQAETERSLGVLAELFGGGSFTPSRSATPAVADSGAAAPSVPPGSAGVDDDVANAGPPLIPTVDVAAREAGGDSVAQVETQEQEGQQQQQQQDDDDEKGRESTAEADGGATRTTAEKKAEEAAAPEGERFVAHMSTLTDIFKVQDKVSTKKNKEEKEKDKGFKVASLFDGLAGGAPLAASAAPAADAAASGGFSFAFGGDRAGPTATTPSDSLEGTAPKGGTGEGGPAARTTAGIAIAPAGGLSSENPGLVPSSAAAASTDGAAGGDPSNSAAGPLSGTVRALWRPLGDVVAVAARFVRTGKREDVESAWLGERRALTQDFKRKHKDAVKGRRGAGAGRGAASKKRRR